MRTYLEFEKPIAELEGKVAELRALAAEDETVAIGDEVSLLEAKAASNLEQILRQPDTLAEDTGGAASKPPSLL